MKSVLEKGTVEVDTRYKKGFNFMATTLCNTIAISMFDPTETHTVQMTPITEDAAIALLEHGFEQAVGHPATADVLKQRTGLDVQFNRANVRIAPGDTLIIAQVVVPRLAEGQVLTREEVEALPIAWWKIEE
jgi:hypothetical protein